MLLKILTAVIAVGVIAITYPYVYAQKDGACPKSLLYKMIGATGYIAVGVLCVIMTGEFSEFDKAMIIALVFSWLGDLFLHLWFHKIFYVLGFLSFLSSHICFIRAYIIGINSMTVYFPEKSFYSIGEIIAIVIFVILFIVCMIRSKMNLKGLMKLPIIIYGIVIMTMLCKASILGIEAVKAEITPFILVCAILGAVCFVLSDFSISFLMFDKRHKKNFKLKLFNMYTYFAAEILLASLVYFI
ncbi:MAG: lysoplasmalogenase [Clostridia bacterium]|nr:lysoplasmalogenase [Clostridia bacterium]